ncbi:MAG: GNAT family N-acetyltransferase [Bacteroidota bacterium]
MDLVEINNIKYGFVKDYKDDDSLRTSFNQLTQSIFHFSLENWYQSGNWKSYYIPYSLTYQDEVVSNVSINRLSFSIDQSIMTGIQIGTVMTHENFRNKGLNQFLLEQILTEWKEQCDFIYLFANDTVLDFYPKFNFVKTEEYQASKMITPSPADAAMKKLNTETEEDAALLLQTIEKSKPISRIAMLNNPSLIMFYCTSFMKDLVYYVEKFKSIVLVHFEGETMHLLDVFSEEHIDLESLIEAIADENIHQVVLGFTPLKDNNYEKNKVTGADTLFILKGQNTFMDGRKWMFPELSHA